MMSEFGRDPNADLMDSKRGTVFVRWITGCLRASCMQWRNRIRRHGGSAEWVD